MTVEYTQMVEYGRFQKQWLAKYGTINLAEWRIVVVPIPRAMWIATAETDAGNELDRLGNSIFNGAMTVEDIRASQPELYRRYGRTLRRLEADAIRKNTSPEWVYVGDWQPNPADEEESYLTRQTNLARDVYHYWPQA